MSWLGWIWIGIACASAYWFAQIGYFIYQGATRMKQAIAVSSSIVSELQSLPTPVVAKIEATQPEQRTAILSAMRRRRKLRNEEAERRQRRLVARIEKLISEGGKSR